MSPNTNYARAAVALALLALVPAATRAQQITDSERARIDSAALAVLAGTGAPSASVAIVRGGRIVHEQAYGHGCGDGTPAATPQMRYAIGSVSKQFTATAILMLAEQGKLTLDDKVSRWFPQLTRADEISIRQLLTMTSGYQDFWPQDYVMTVDPDMRRNVPPAEIMRRWAQIPLDFEPGARWQYSNTNYTIAGQIVERVSGVPLLDFIRQRIFPRLGMTSIADFDAGEMKPTDAEPCLRYGLGPLRRAPGTGSGWMNSAGELAMTAHDLALWDLSIIDQSLLRPASYKEMLTAQRLTDGTGTGYGLGIYSRRGRRRVLSHGGAVSGYTSQNVVYPDDKVAIVVLTNIYPGGAGAPEQIADRIASILFARDSADARAVAAARQVYDGLMQGKVDRSLFTPNANAYFSEQALADYAASLGSLGKPTEFALSGESLRGGMTIRSFTIRAGSAEMELTEMIMANGKIEQYIVARAQ